jgi:hypothetical protein
MTSPRSRKRERELFILRWMLKAVQLVGFDFQLMFDLDMRIKALEEAHNGIED